MNENYDFENPETKKFRVFKLSVDGPRRSWVETKNLGDIALFLGENSSISVLASNIAGCQGNCIYFSPIRAGFSTPIYEPKDMGVYNLESGTITSFAIDPEIIAKFYTRSPIWVSQ
ncbi:hypothetical protein TIFTF001_013807 [Ficus carica]|uniref:KIB1-4 beta-propeller domain-containing protein n=1 Tax=Ficus carica TaxID=3494 RepID=A0AA88AQF4_FICCA|nr:hypothetical protein TIFTF001_013807 [Ficus carica]